MGSINTTQDQETEINFLHLKLQWPAGFWRREEERIFFSWKIRTLLVFFHFENLSTLDPIKGEIFKIQNDKCHTLSLWTWHMSNTWTLNLTSVLHMSKFAHFILLRREIQILNFLPSLQNLPIDPSGLSTFESRPILAIGPQTCLGPKTLFVPI